MPPCLLTIHLSQPTAVAPKCAQVQHQVQKRWKLVTQMGTYCNTKVSTILLLRVCLPIKSIYIHVHNLNAAKLVKVVQNIHTIQHDTVMTQV